MRNRVDRPSAAVKSASSSDGAASATTPGRRVTMREVARAAGVSTQTVSRVLNHRPDVAAETVTRVRAVIAELGYSPNLLARGLTQGRTHILGVVAYGLEYFGPSRIITGIEQRAATLGYAISLTLVHRPDTEAADEILTNLMSRQVDGILWAIPEVADNRASLRYARRDVSVPLVLVGGTPVEHGFAAIGIDNQMIGRLATEHLVAGGARRIGIITGPLDWWEARQRQEGWRATLEARGDSLDGLVAEGDWTPASGEAGLRQLLDAAPGLDAVFASNDQMALGALHAAHRAGRRVPEDLALVGVDDIAEGSHLWPPLTTVHQPLREAGMLAVQTIDHLIRAGREGDRPAEVTTESSTLLRPRLIIRDSSHRIRGRSTAPGRRS